MPAHALEQVVQIVELPQQPLGRSDTQRFRTAKRKVAEALLNPKSAVEIAFDGRQHRVTATHELRAVAQQHRLLRLYRYGIIFRVEGLGMQLGQEVVQPLDEF